MNEYYKFKTQVNYKVAIFTQIMRLSEKATVEFRGGYWQEKNQVLPSGVAIKTKEYTPDSRDVFCNGVIALYLKVKPLIFEKLKSDERLRSIFERCQEYYKWYYTQISKQDTRNRKEEDMAKKLQGCMYILENIHSFLHIVNYFEEEAGFHDESGVLELDK